MTTPLLVVEVYCHVRPEHVDAFRSAIIANARESRKEKGIARFDVVTDPEDSTRFVLIEAYRDAEAIAEHKKTQHYATWRATVEEMMAEPRTSKHWLSVDPEPSEW